MTLFILRTRNGDLDREDLPEFERLNARLKSTPGSKVLLHLHGGLVEEAEGMKIAKRLSGKAGEGGFGLGDDWEQIFIVWRTGPLETIRTNWTELLTDGRLRKAMMPKLMEFLARKLGLPGVEARAVASQLNLNAQDIRDLISGPSADGLDPFWQVDKALELNTPDGRGPKILNDDEFEMGAEIAALLGSHTDLQDVARDIAEALSETKTAGRAAKDVGDAAAGAEEFRRLSDNIQDELRREAPVTPSGRRGFIESYKVLEYLVKHGIAIGLRVIDRFREKRDHGFHATVVEEFVREIYGDLFGAKLWGLMQRDAADHFSASGKFGRQLLALLREVQPTRVALTGHSAGSIWQCEMLRAMAEEGRFTNIRVAFLAPAVRIDHFAETMARADGLVDGFRIFTMSDVLECSDPVLGKGREFLYPRSLLYLISGILEEYDAEAFVDCPLLGMQRYHRSPFDWLEHEVQVAAATSTYAYLTTPSSRVIYSNTRAEAEEGRRTAASSHGAFDQDPLTLASVKHFVEEPSP